MRVQKVNDSTIRIFISLTELADRDISMTDLFQRSPKTEQLFWELIAQAREEVEFNLDQPFWIQATVASNDEFVITVMKQEELGEIPVKEKEKEKEKEKKRINKNRILELAYVFKDLEDVLSLVERLPELPQLRSSLFEYDNEYYLMMSQIGTGKKRQLTEALLEEYGEPVSSTSAFLSEHGKLILLDRAVQQLSSAFSKADK